ncbi:MAG TPA: hypothetical protein VFW83_07565 [Bryobacteraceae bacterium]|nr:hypothetical protein [Bryobacteraceae bacterium]
MRDDKNTSFTGDRCYVLKRLCTPPSCPRRIFTAGQRVADGVLKECRTGLRKTLVYFLAGEAFSRAKVHFDEALVYVQRDLRGISGWLRREACA